MAQVTLSHEANSEDIRALMVHWGTARDVFKKPNVEPDDVGLATTKMKISLKHFLEDMYSVANYASVLRLFPADAAEHNILEEELRNVYPDFDDSAWFASRLKGRGALRNIATHRRLPTVVWATTVEGVKEFVSQEMNDDKQNRALSVRSTGTFEGMVKGLLKEGFINAEVAAAWMRHR
jgi:hypothetical protein